MMKFTKNQMAAILLAGLTSNFLQGCNKDDPAEPITCVDEDGDEYVYEDVAGDRCNAASEAEVFIWQISDDECVCALGPLCTEGTQRGDCATCGESDVCSACVRPREYEVDEDSPWECKLIPEPMCVASDWASDPEDSAANCVQCDLENDVCATCFDNYFVTDPEKPWECQICPLDNCGTCADVETCSVCDPDYFVDGDSQCEQCAVANCVESTSDGVDTCECTTCENGYELLEADSSCNACTAVTDCSVFQENSCRCETCEFGFQNNDGVCEDCDDATCAAFGPETNCECITCIPNYFNAPSCEQCPAQAGCATTTSDGETCVCETCNTGLENVDGACVECGAIDNCVTVTSDGQVCSCGECEIGFENVDGVCVACGSIDNCAIVTSDGQVCSCAECDLGFENVAGVCTACDDATCAVFGNVNSCECTQCVADYFNAPNCEPCESIASDAPEGQCGQCPSHVFVTDTAQCLPGTCEDNNGVIVEGSDDCRSNCDANDVYAPGPSECRLCESIASDAPEGQCDQCPSHVFLSDIAQCVEGTCESPYFPVTGTDECRSNCDGSDVYFDGLNQCALCTSIPVDATEDQCATQCGYFFIYFFTSTECRDNCTGEDVFLDDDGVCKPVLEPIGDCQHENVNDCNADPNCTVSKRFDGELTCAPVDCALPSYQSEDRCNDYSPPHCGWDNLDNTCKVKNLDALTSLGEDKCNAVGECTWSPWTIPGRDGCIYADCSLYLDNFRCVQYAPSWCSWTISGSPPDIEPNSCYLPECSRIGRNQAQCEFYEGGRCRWDGFQCQEPL